MPKRMILKDFELTEISSVDRPAQTTALATIMKRKDGEAPFDKQALTALIKQLIAQPLTKEAAMPATKEAEKIVALELKVTKLSGDLTAALKLSDFSDEERSFAKAMDNADSKKEFEGMTPEERKAKMKLAKADDESIVVSGATISKSVVGDGVFLVLKAQQNQLDAQKVILAKAQDDAETALLTKRATDDFGSVPGTALELATLLKAAKAMPEAAQVTLETIMKASNATQARVAVTHGTSFGKNAADTDAHTELDTLAKAHAKDNDVNYASAYAAVIEKRADLYERVINELS